MPSPNERAIIREVWAENLDQEMALLRDLVDQYPYLAMVGTNDSTKVVPHFVNLWFITYHGKLESAFCQ
jgi:hypothetical protein